MVVVGVAKAFAKGLVKVTKTTAKKVDDAAKALAETAGTSERKIATKTARTALKTGTAAGLVAGGGLGYMASQPTVDTNHDGEPDMDFVEYIVTLPGRALEAVTKPQTLLLVGAIAVIAVVVLKK